MLRFLLLLWASFWAVACNAQVYNVVIVVGNEVVSYPLNISLSDKSRVLNDASYIPGQLTTEVESLPDSLCLSFTYSSAQSKKYQKFDGKYVGTIPRYLLDQDFVILYFSLRSKKDRNGELTGVVCRDYEMYVKPE